MQQVLILGDFNAKVDTYIEGNKPTMTKGERQLMKMAKKCFGNNKSRKRSM